MEFIQKKLIKDNYAFLYFFGVLAALLFLFLGNVNLFDWDEANFAEIAREMILSKNYLQPQINYLPFYEKPPLFIWFQVISMKLFGINEFAARFPNALLGLMLAYTLFRIGKEEVDIRFGKLWVMTYLGSLLPFMYFRTGLIDPWFNYFMFLSLYFFYRASKENGYKFLIFSCFALGLAVQTKGPVGIIIVFGTLGIVFILSRFKFHLGWGKDILWVMLSIFFSSLWFLYETYMNGTEYFYEFIKYQIRLLTTEDALHGGPFYYHFVVLLLGCLPSSILLFNKKVYKKIYHDLFGKIMLVCGILVLVLFSIVQTKIIHYSSMAYFPISYIGAIVLYNYDIEKNKRKLISGLIISMCFILAVFPIIGVNIPKLLPLIQDKQAILQLGQYVPWSYLECLWGLGLLALFLGLSRFSITKKYSYFLIIPCFIFIFMVIFSPKIERYTQGTYIDFCKSKKYEDCYIQALYMKTYAIYFYSDRQPFNNTPEKNFNWLYIGPIDKKVYFISRNKDNVMQKHNRPDVKILFQENGYDFLYRNVPDK